MPEDENETPAAPEEETDALHDPRDAAPEEPSPDPDPSEGPGMKLYQEEQLAAKQKTGEGAATRADFDDVDDYLNWVALPPQAKDGTPVPGCADWKRGSTVSANPPVTGGEDLRQIVVSVQDSAGRATQLVAFRSPYSDPSQAVTEETTVAGRVGVELQIGTTAEGWAFSGVALANQPKAE